ncbi:MAG: IclR family transcriptional regulator [Chloroflexi bacterium]|nr:IclR family transcriptional regulator [Chloroflexota bacterium]
MDILELFTRDGQASLTLSDVVNLLGIHKSSAFRHLVTLEQRGFVERDPDTETFHLGFRLFELGAHAVNRLGIREISLPHMRSILNQFEETVNLGVLSGSEIVYLEILDSPRPMRLAARVGQRDPMHSTALGKAIAAYLPREQLEAILMVKGLPQITGRTITSLEAFKAELAEVAECGYALNVGENEEGSLCISAPLLDRTGYPIGALSVSAPADHIEPGTQKDISQALLTASHAISRQLGYLS